jgi:hypothetical protein
MLFVDSFVGNHPTTLQKPIVGKRDFEELIYLTLHFDFTSEHPLCTAFSKLAPFS